MGKGKNKDSETLLLVTEPVDWLRKTEECLEEHKETIEDFPEAVDILLDIPNRD